MYIFSRTIVHNWWDFWCPRLRAPKATPDWVYSVCYHKFHLTPLMNTMHARITLTVSTYICFASAMRVIEYRWQWHWTCQLEHGRILQNIVISGESFGVPYTYLVWQAMHIHLSPCMTPNRISLKIFLICSPAGYAAAPWLVVSRSCYNNSLVVYKGDNT